MPELLVDFITSLDGYGAAEGWPGWWGLEGPEYLAWLGEQPDDYAAAGEPGTYVLADRSKVVFSTTLTDPLAWPNTELVSGDPIEEVRQRKEYGSRPLTTLGSLTLCRSLLNAGLVDRFRVGVFPVITGNTVMVSLQSELISWNFLKRSHSGK